MSRERPRWERVIREQKLLIHGTLRIIKVTVDKKGYHVKVTYDKSEVYCYTGQCVEFPNAISEGKTMEELKENMKEVIEMTLEPLPDEVVKRSA